MIDIDDLYFRWLMSRFSRPTTGLTRLCWMLHENIFQRRVGNDENRAKDGLAFRGKFLDDYQDADIDPRIVANFVAGACSWFEMLLALAEALDYVYDGGVDERFLEMISNLSLDAVMTRVDSRYDEIDQEFVDSITNIIDGNQFGPDGQGGLFPLRKHDHPDQREVEIWDQQAAYFRERLEGIVWTFTK